MLTVDDQPVDLDKDPRPVLSRTVVQTADDRRSGLGRLVGSLFGGGPSRLAVHYGLDGVQLVHPDGTTEDRGFDAAFDHELGEWIPRRLRFLVQARAELKGEKPGTRRRTAIELAARHREDFPEARRVTIAWVPTGLRIFSSEEGARECRRDDIEVWAVPCAPNGPFDTWWPKLGKRWARRYEIPYGER